MAMTQLEKSVIESRVEPASASSLLEFIAVVGLVLLIVMRVLEVAGTA